MIDFEQAAIRTTSLIIPRDFCRLWLCYL